MTIISTTVGKNPLQEMQQPLQSTRIQNAVFRCNLNALFKDKSFNTEVEWFYADLQDLLKLTPPKDVFFIFIIGDGNAKVESQETPGVTGKFGLGVRNETGQRLIEFYQENNNTKEDPTHGHHQMVNSKIRLIIFFAAKDGEALYSQQKQDQELTMAQIMSSLLPNSDLN